MNVKEMVGRQAANAITDGMIVGLGTGSTAYYFVDEIGKRCQAGLSIIGVTTSLATQKQARELGIPLKTVDEVSHIDVTVDGADEINGAFNGIKGGGGALLFEKIVAKQSKKVIWIVDSSKMVESLGKFPLPVEVVKYGSQHVYHYLEQRGYHPVFREQNSERYVTDDGNFIIDLHMEHIADEYALANELTSLVGVVEHGLFLDMTTTVLVGTENGVETLQHV